MFLRAARKVRIDWNIQGVPSAPASRAEPRETQRRNAPVTTAQKRKKEGTSRGAFRCRVLTGGLASANKSDGLLYRQIYVKKCFSTVYLASPFISLETEGEVEIHTACIYVLFLFHLLWYYCMIIFVTIISIITIIIIYIDFCAVPFFSFIFLNSQMRKVLGWLLCICFSSLMFK